VEAVKELCGSYRSFDVCPELAGGLTCPRERNEITGGTGRDVVEGRARPVKNFKEIYNGARVLSSSGADNTEKFLRGSRKAVEVALANKVEVAILKSRSPSCGKYKIHAGTFDGTMRLGEGVTAALLMKHGVKVFTEHEVEEAKRELSA